MATSTGTKTTTTKAANMPLSNRARTIVISAASGLSTAGVIAQLQDADDVGSDDEIGAALQAAGEVFRKIGTSGKAFGRNDILKAIADGLYIRIGLEPVESA